VIRRLLWLAVVVALAWAVRSLMASRRSRRVPPRGGTETREAMVRDRVCNTFLPRSRALLVRHRDEDLFFCSEACRASYLEGRRRVS
jgi:hypothetical protein